MTTTDSNPAASRHGLKSRFATAELASPTPVSVLQKEGQDAAWAKELRHLLSPGELQAHVRAQVTKALRLEFRVGEREDIKTREAVMRLRDSVLEAIFNHRLKDLGAAGRDELYQLAYTDLDAAYTFFQQARTAGRTFNAASEPLVRALAALLVGLLHPAPKTEAWFEVEKPRRKAVERLRTKPRWSWGLWWATFNKWLDTPTNVTWRQARGMVLKADPILAGGWEASPKAITATPAVATDPFPRVGVVRMRDDTNDRFVSYPGVAAVDAVKELKQVWEGLISHELGVEDRYVVDAVAADYLPDSLHLLMNQTGNGEAARAEAERLFIEQVVLMTQQLSNIRNRIADAGLAASRAQSAFLRGKVPNREL